MTEAQGLTALFMFALAIVTVAVVLITGWIFSLRYERDEANKRAEQERKETNRVQSWGVPKGPRMCANCGRICLPDEHRGDITCGLLGVNGEVPCVIDYSYDELVAMLRETKADLARRTRGQFKPKSES